MQDSSNFQFSPSHLLSTPRRERDDRKAPFIRSFPPFADFASTTPITSLESPSLMQTAIQVSGLRKSYGPVEAVRGIEFEVQQGEVFGLLGPNGAGKTTTVEILEGLRDRTAGEVKVLGVDPAVEVQTLKDRIGVCLQATKLPDKVRVHEALEWFGAFYSRTADCKKLLDRLQLSEKRNEFYSLLSGGQKQRVALALALVN